MAAAGTFPQRESARRLHGVTILRSRELRMMDLELTRWKHVGLFYKQLKSSPLAPFLNSAFSISTAGLLGCWAELGEGQKRDRPFGGPAMTSWGAKDFCMAHPI